MRAGVRIRKDPFNAVGAYTVVPVTDFLREGCKIRWGLRTVNDEKVVTAGCGFDEGNGHSAGFYGAARGGASLSC